MPLCSDRDLIRTVLANDPGWCAYALGDLKPDLFADCLWFVNEARTALILLFGAYRVPVLFAYGAAAAVEPLLDEVPSGETYLSIKPEISPLVRRRWDVQEETAMLRMVLDLDALACNKPEPQPGLRRLRMPDAPALGRLYDDGRVSGEVPDFFRLSMVRDGVFFGVFEGEEMVAAAGTHLVARSEKVGAVGNVYTRRDRRGRGLATATTTAVAAELTRVGCRTVVLNVMEGNEPAQHAYERVGFRVYCPFFEGFAVR